MNILSKLFIFLYLILPVVSFSQAPLYNLTAKNFSHPAPNVLQFDIFIEHTNAPTTFEYSGGQYFFNFNPLIANGGTLSYTYAGDTSELPQHMRPRNPQISGNQLRLASNLFPGAGNGFIMTNNGNPGTRIVSMKLTTTAPSLTNAPLSFEWRNNLPDPYTKIYAYVGNTNTNITSNAVHSIDSSGIILTFNLKVAIDGLLKTAFHVHNRRDTVTVYLAKSVAPYNYVDSATNIIDSLSLSATFTYRNAVNGTYYLVVKHYNSLETWSKAGGETVMNGNIYNYDFTTSASKAYGNNLALRGTLYCIYSGDVNQDYIIDISDLSDVDNDVFTYASGFRPTDFNGDFVVEGRDMSIIDNNRNKLIRNPIYGD
ncbi:MAG TPA: hypothetical protein PK294_00365 [Ignavibacteria bacterium]|nr:hypothetical protein [Ignavibacteria bacterium]HQY53484.1 hypothetical protein [Ignavibacteria bacterium]HRA98862.1 hypothetical protein [Ignavibacteria bacterium]